MTTKRRKKTPLEQRGFKIREAAPDDPIYTRGFAIGVTRLTAPAKRTGLVSVTEGAMYSAKDSPTTVSFAYFRTKSGKPPEVEKAEQEKLQKPKGRKK